MDSTLNDFRKLNGLPDSLDRFAYEASKVSDYPDLRKAGEEYLKAEARLFEVMRNVGVELG